MSRKLHNIELNSEAELALANAKVMAIEGGVKFEDLNTNEKLVNYALSLLGKKIKEVEVQKEKIIKLQK